MSARGFDFVPVLEPREIANWNSLEITIHKIISGETSIAFAYNSLQSESMTRATPANMPH